MQHESFVIYQGLSSGSATFVEYLLSKVLIHGGLIVELFRSLNCLHRHVDVFRLLKVKSTDSCWSQEDLTVIHHVEILIQNVLSSRIAVKLIFNSSSDACHILFAFKCSVHSFLAFQSLIFAVEQI